MIDFETTLGDKLDDLPWPAAGSKETYSEHEKDISPSYQFRPNYSHSFFSFDS